MGFLNLFNLARPRPTVQQLPAGSVTVDRNGHIVIGTVPSSYPAGLLQNIAAEVLRVFQEARLAELPLTEFSFYFASLRVTARELRGGAIIFLSPQTTFATPAVPPPHRL